MPHARSEAAAPLRRLAHYSRSHRKTIWRATLCSMLNKVFDLAPPFLIGLAIDVVARREDSVLSFVGVTSPLGLFLVLAGLTAITWVLESLFEYWSKVLWRNLAQTIQHELRLDAYENVQHLDMAFFEDESTGTLMSILNDDVNQLERFLDVGASTLIQLATATAVITAVFFAMAPGVAWLAMLPIPFVLWGSLWFQKKIAPHYANVREEVGAVNSLLANNLGGVATIKAFAREPHELERLRVASDQYREVNRRAIRLSSAFTPLIRMAILVGFGATLIYGGWQAIHGHMELATFSTLAFLTQRLLWPMTRLGETFDLYQRSMASTERVLDLLDRKTGVESGKAEMCKTDVEGALRLDDVTFRYADGQPILSDLTMDMPAGSTVAVVGPTGSGKTTLVKLLLRFYDPTSGRVTLDGTDVRTLRKSDLRAAIGLVSQDVFLFHGTVRENIAYGRLDATEDELTRAADLSESTGFINELPQGFDTIVGERGQKLSGGQRQRLSIARAILKDPPILILDEATSSVDNETEAAIQRSLDRVAVGRTTIVIAHRLSTVRNADRIYVLDGGRLKETGTHDELITLGGLYEALWRVQTGERQCGVGKESTLSDARN